MQPTESSRPKTEKVYKEWFSKACQREKKKRETLRSIIILHYFLPFVNTLGEFLWVIQMFPMLVFKVVGLCNANCSPSLCSRVTNDFVLWLVCACLPAQKTPACRACPKDGRQACGEERSKAILREEFLFC